MAAEVLCEQSLFAPKELHEISRIELLQVIARGVNLDKYAKDEYGASKAKKLLQKLGSIAPEYKKLVVDPGVAVRAGDFVGFVQSLANKPESPWEARKLYSEFLGTRRVYRAITIEKKDALKEILSEGLGSKFLFSSSYHVEFLRWERLELQLQEGLIKAIHRRFGKVLDGRLRYSLMNSVSDFPEMALGIGNSVYAESGETRANEKIALFTLGITVLDIIDPSNSDLVQFPFYLGMGSKYFNILLSSKGILRKIRHKKLP